MISDKPQIRRFRDLLCYKVFHLKLAHVNPGISILYVWDGYQTFRDSFYIEWPRSRLKNHPHND